MTKLSSQQIALLRDFNDCMVEHPAIQVIFQDFDDLRLNRLFQIDQQCMLLTGDTGVGKSHLIRHYKKRVQASQLTSSEKIPVLISRISSNKGLDSTLIQILADLDLFGSGQQKAKYKVDLKKKVVTVLKRAQVEILFINEFQELIEFKSVQERQVIANALKYISEEARVPIVLVGMPWAELIAEESQWSSRLARRRHLSYFSLKEDRDYFLKYLVGLAKFMPFSKPPKLHSKHTAIALFAACRGENRALKHLLSEALKLALITNAKTLETAHLQQAFSNIHASSIIKSQISGSVNTTTCEGLQNPFSFPVEEILVSELSEESRYNHLASVPEEARVPRLFTDWQVLF